MKDGRTLAKLTVLALALSLILLCPAYGEDRVILTIGDMDTRSGTRYNADLGMWQYVAEQAGVEIRYVYLSEEEYASGLSSGDLPDLVATQSNLSTIRENGVALNVDPYLEEYAPNFLQGATRASYDVFKQLEDGEDGFYFFPARIGYNGVGYGNSTGARGYVVRWDYYKELGYPPIHNEDDYLEVLKQMHANHPFTEEGYPTYLYGTANFNGSETAFRAELDLEYWAAYKYQNNIFTNEVFDGYTDPAHSKWWAAMAWENKLYRAGMADGSYDIELFTHTKDQYDSKCRRGQYMGLNSTQGSLYNERVKTDPDTLAGYVVVPTSAANYYSNVYQLLGNGTNYMWFISANSPHKEAALRLINVMCDPEIVREMYMGRKGETWDYDEDGTARMTEYGREQLDDYTSGNASPDNYFTRWGYGRLPSNWPILRDTAVHPDGNLLDFVTVSREYKAAAMTNKISLDMCGHYGVELPTDAWYQDGGFDFRNDCGEAISSCISGLTRDQLHIISRAEEILNEAVVYLIVAETDEEWNAVRDETIQKLIDLGEPEVFEAYKQKWDAAAAVIVPLVHQAQTENGIKPYTPDQYENHP